MRAAGQPRSSDEPPLQVVLDRLDVVVGDSLDALDRRRLRLPEPLDPPLEGLAVVVRQRWQLRQLRKGGEVLEPGDLDGEAFPDQRTL